MTIEMEQNFTVREDITADMQQRQKTHERGAIIARMNRSLRQVNGRLDKKLVRDNLAATAACHFNPILQRQWAFDIRS